MLLVALLQLPSPPTITPILIDSGKRLGRRRKRRFKKLNLSRDLGKKPELEIAIETLGHLHEDILKLSPGIQIIKNHY